MNSALLPKAVLSIFVIPVAFVIGLAIEVFVFFSAPTVALPPPVFGPIIDGFTICPAILWMIWVSEAPVLPRLIGAVLALATSAFVVFGGSVILIGLDPARAVPDAIPTWLFWHGAKFGFAVVAVYVSLALSTRLIKFLSKEPTAPSI